MNLLRVLLLFLFCLSLSCRKSSVVPVPDLMKANITTSKITITFFASPQTYNITIPELKYNKDFCLGFHLDDGAQDIYTSGYKLLDGGIIDGITYEGLSYTDGCGNDIRFKMSTAIYSLANDQIADVHNEAGYYIRWSQVNELYKKGWGVYNHGYTADPTLDPLYSVVNNHIYVKSKTNDAVEGGIDMRIFVNPNGIDSYTNFAFQENYRLCFVEHYTFGNPYFDVTTSWIKGNIRMGRTNLVSNIDLTEIVDEMAALSINGSHYWGSVFSHSITNATFGYDFEMFKEYMTYISDTYGKNGQDNIWMTTEEETLDYSILKDLLVVNESWNGNILEITFSGDLPDDLRFYNTSLVVSASNNIQSIEISGALESSSYNGINKPTALINIDCSDK